MCYYWMLLCAEVLLTSVIIDIWEHLLISVYILIEGNNVSSQNARGTSSLSYELSHIGGLLLLMPYEK